MNTEEAIERLPWLLNGTLTPVEEAGVRERLRTSERCRLELRQALWAARAGRVFPSTSQLVDLAFGRPVEDRALLDEHLRLHDDDAELVELTRRSVHLQDGALAILDRHPAARRTWGATALAASLAALVATGGWLYTWQSRPGTAFPTASANREVVTAYPEQTVRGPGDSKNSLSVSLASSMLTVKLESFHDWSPEAGPFTLEVLDGERSVLTLTEVELKTSYHGEVDSDGAEALRYFTLDLPLEELPRGPFQIRVSAVEPASGEVREEIYHLEVDR